MKKLLVVLAIGSFAACNSSASSDTKAAADSSVNATADSAKTAIDSTANAAKDSLNAKVDSLKK
jgi:uncharacterized protein (UPF0333 family)